MAEEIATIGQLRQLLSVLPDEAYFTVTNMDGTVIPFEISIHNDEQGYAEDEYEAEMILGVYDDGTFEPDEDNE